MTNLRPRLALLLVLSQLGSAFVTISRHEHSASRELGERVCRTDHSARENPTWALGERWDARPEGPQHVHRCIGCQAKVQIAGARASASARMEPPPRLGRGPVPPAVSLDSQLGFSHTSRGPPPS